MGEPRPVQHGHQVSLIPKLLKVRFSQSFLDYLPGKLSKISLLRQRDSLIVKLENVDRCRVQKRMDCSPFAQLRKHGV
ncbi:hypothetical protein MPNT_40180 [Candidatus Methylacidithermus pantelleriae]|uniref:Uncharacterized protein n=1 Tax=Candidatus Methylacidithermus pantelleriae TaxID=2744239 RepID=A0A8J2BPK6_9BACT|nr:hypothetical protein MPNT_40180 [Candidatus Methylacidithermus pantelleriae]